MPVEILISFMIGIWINVVTAKQSVCKSGVGGQYEIGFVSGWIKTIELIDTQ